METPQGAGQTQGKGPPAGLAGARPTAPAGSRAEGGDEGPSSTSQLRRGPTPTRTHVRRSGRAERAGSARPRPPKLSEPQFPQLRPSRK